MGRGVEKICNALKADNLPMPEYTVNSGDIMIKFTGPEDRIIRVSGRLSEKLSERLSDKLSDKEQRTLGLLLSRNDRDWCGVEKNGVSEMSLDEINAEIENSRKERQVVS